MTKIALVKKAADVLKDENLEVTETKELNGILFVSLLLHPKTSYICPLCNSNYVIKMVLEIILIESSIIK